jgi:hypothetical protein
MSNYFCYYCKTEKEANCFAVSQRKFHGGRNVGRCKECSKIQNKEYRELNIEKFRQYEASRRSNHERVEYDRLRSYPRRYGISREQYEQMRIQQSFKCAICGMSEEEHKVSRWGVLCLDHDHKTGAVRALLCALCNKGLGSFKDNHNLLEKASNYLRSFEKVKGVS